MVESITVGVRYQAAQRITGKPGLTGSRKTNPAFEKKYSIISLENRFF